MTDDVRRGEVAGFLRRARLFVIIGGALYAGLYVVSEALVLRHAQRNRFHVVQTAERDRYDYVLLGASHSAVFDYRDLNARLEQISGASVMNLSTLGSGLTVNRLLLEYFLLEHEAGAVVYVLDSFAFYSDSWNEQRLQDRELFLRAPWDPALAALLVRHPAGRRSAVDYALGFSKINNAGRFEPDSFPAEGSRFDRSYRPVAQIDRQRIDFLYPEGANLASPHVERYMAELESLVDHVRGRGARFLVVRPPIPQRMRELMPGEDEFDLELSRLLERLDVPLHDFSRVNNADSLFYDSDHLNREGALMFFEEYLGPVLAGSG